MKSSNHYEAAFEAYLKSLGRWYIAIDEARRKTMDGEPIKSLDFIVYGDGDARWLIDVKGRKYPSGTETKPQYTWQNWTTLEDLNALRRWEERFGHNYVGLLLFAYEIQSHVDLPLGTIDLFYYQSQRFLFRGVEAQQYRKKMRVRSPKWGTVGLLQDDFRQLVLPVSHWIQAVK